MIKFTILPILLIIHVLSIIQISGSIIDQLKQSNDPVIHPDTGIVISYSDLLYIERVVHEPVIFYLPVTKSECLMLSAPDMHENFCTADEGELLNREKRQLFEMFRTWQTIKSGSSWWSAEQNVAQMKQLEDQAQKNQITSSNNSAEIYMVANNDLKLVKEMQATQNELLQIESEINKSIHLTEELKNLHEQIMKILKRMNSDNLVRTMTDIYAKNYNFDFLSSGGKGSLLKLYYNRLKTVLSHTNVSTALLLNRLIIEQSLQFIKYVNSSSNRNASVDDTKVIGKLIISTILGFPGKNDDESVFDLYHLATVPFFNEAVAHITTNIPTYIGISRTHDKFIELYSDDTKDCTITGKIMLCKHELVVTNVLQNSCLRQLLKIDMDHDACHFERVPLSQFRVLNVGVNTWILAATEPPQCYQVIQCSRRKSPRQINPMSLLSLECNTTMYCLPYFTLHSDISACTRQTQNVFVLSRGEVVRHSSEYLHLSNFTTHNRTSFIQPKRMYSLIKDINKTANAAKDTSEKVSKVKLFSLEMDPGSATGAGFVLNLIVILVLGLLLTCYVHKSLSCIPRLT
ncbi:unnamed protein product [Didymodactylos carnosus]|uniref:Envelope protein n=1 Tax=Didymodactylos carnosus TaxID=1234261 RepID=A0A815KAB0_9BILA|nr:unnamed protein product [Didymodactylos carnosus]CAF1387190.1 unnamed protein product [Didymodactylos carnosus]CAF4166409.1 unnamed protein product [Didymodactylos carnosus]CAF4282033.1 unnamed protein product [Didymodactylos carnosus]